LVSEVKGIYPSDLIIGSAINTALQRLRDDPSLVDDIFAKFTDDDMTSQQYGQSYIDQAKKWFLSTNVPVSMTYRVDEADCPIITIGLQESTEAEQTHSDVHYVPEEDLDDTNWPPLTQKFDVVQYAASSGLIVLPASVTSTVMPAIGMSILDAEGRAYPLIEILDDETVAIAPMTIASFRGAVLKGPRSKLVSNVESVNFRETYVVGCHVMGESSHLSYLHSIVLYSLLRYKQDLLEGRGLERTTLSSAEFRRNDLTGNELMFSRAIIVNGFVRQSWRKNKLERIQKIDDSNFIFEKVNFSGVTQVDDAEAQAQGYTVENGEDPPVPVPMDLVPVIPVPDLGPPVPVLDDEEQATLTTLLDSL
jgi:hypothetical protein